MLNRVKSLDDKVQKCEMLKNCIDKFLTKYPNLSLANVKEKTNLDQSTLRRIVKLDGNPDLESAIKIFRSLGHEKDFEKYLTTFHFEISDTFINKNFHNSKYTLIEDENSDLFTDEAYFLILSLAYSETGTTQEEINFHFGEVGNVKIEELIQKNLIIEKNKTYFGKVENYKFNFSDTKKRVELFNRQYNLSEAGGELSWISTQTQRLSKEGLVELKKLLQSQAIERNEKIFSNSKYMGKVQTFCTSCSGPLLPIKEEGI